MGVAVRILFCVLVTQGVCGDWSISLPDQIEALDGSCVTINCRFDIDSKYDIDLTDTAVGKWIKDNGETVFDSRKPTNSQFKGNITEKLTEKKCTTVFYDVKSNHKGLFYFRIEGNRGLLYTYKQKYLKLDVIGSPPSPTVKMFMGQMEVQEVLEGSAVNLRCSSKTLCSSSPPTLTWSSTDRLILNDNSRPQQQQQTETEIISNLNFTATHLQHGVTYSCNITYQLHNRNTTAQNNITLYVLYAPKNTSVSVFPSNSVLEGTSVTLKCRSDANPAVLNYTWYRENRGQLEQIQSGLNLTFNTTDHTNTGHYYCLATNQQGAQNASVFLDIQYAPKNTSVSVFPSNSVLEGTSVTLKCRSDANPAVLNYTWYRENRGQWEQIQSGLNLTFHVTNSTHTGRYYCHATNQHGTQNASVFLDIQYAPQISNSSSFIHGDVKVYACQIHGNPYSKVEWRLSGLPVCNSTYTFINEEQLSRTDWRSFITLSLSQNTDTLECVGTNSHGTTSLKFQPPQKKAGLETFSMLAGIAVGASIMTILWVTTYVYKWCSRTRKEDKTGLYVNAGAFQLECAQHGQGNPVALSPGGDATLNHPEALHYSTIEFKNTQTKSGEIRGVSLPNTDYAVIQYNGQVS